MTTSNIGSVIDGVEDTRDCLERGSRDVAEDEGDQIHRLTLKNYRRDPEWLGRTEKAIRNQLRRNTNGKYSSHIYINGMMAPHAKIAEMGSGKRANRTKPARSQGPRPLEAAPKSDYRGDFNYDAPPMSRELQLSILAWIKTKPILAEDEESLAGDIAATIADKGTYAHPFLRPAWEDRTHVPTDRPTERSPVVDNVKDMVEDCFD